SVSLMVALPSGPPVVLVTRPLTETPAAVGASCSGAQNPPNRTKSPPELDEVTAWPPLTTASRSLPLTAPPLTEITLLVISKSPPDWAPASPGQRPKIQN